MSSLLDIMMSTVLLGVLALTIARVQINVSASMCESQFSYVTQTNAVALARQIEFDFAKIGHHVSGQKIFWGDTTGIQFLADLTNTSVVDNIQYSIGDTSQAQMTLNRGDFPLFRRSGSQTGTQYWGLTSFRLTFYDDNYNVIPTPITTPVQCGLIHAIGVAFKIESPEPVYSGYDTTWAAVAWEKMIVPRNLGNLNY